ncbi:histidine phosphatase family protein [Streptomyces sp. NPDC046685]|uniref:SixA phosphatase family protein n=1 Tax=Streptomyces sp. NPDC046685 TaxID=3157202 RepID=UPI0033DD2838
MSRWAPARLVVLRHAKSAWLEDVADHERPLAGRGRRDAPVAGRWLHEATCEPDLVICSPARRTRETWELGSAELGVAPEVVFEPRVYAAGASMLVGVLREVPEERRTVLLIGHQPGVQDLVLSLAGDGDDEALARARVKFPTCALAVLMLPGPWARLAPGTAVLTAFAVPRGPTVRR